MAAEPATPAAPGAFYRRAWTFYLIVAILGLIWLGARNGLDPAFFWPWPGAWIDLLLGVAAALLLLGAWHLGRRFLDPLVQLERLMQALIGPLAASEAFALAVISGIAEEVFFRGAVQSSWGWIWATALFALLHTGPGPVFRLWTLFALCAGLVFAGLTVYRESVLAAMVAHFLVNWVQLRHLARMPPVEPATREQGT